MVLFSCARARVCVFKQHLFVGRGKNETFLIWKVAYENCRLVQPDSEDFFSTIEVKMPHNNLPALAQVCYYFLFKHNKMQAESYTHLEFKMFFFENDLLSSKVVTETKMKVLPKRNVTLPFHRCVRGSVLWVHPNKEAVKSFRVPDCVFVSHLWPCEPHKS